MGKPPVDLRSALRPRFDVKQELGRGGMGTVLLAHDTRLDRDVALKILTPEVSSAVGAERFAREIRLTARLVHPNVVPLFDSGQVKDSLYYVMPYIDGQTLRQRLDREGPLGVAEVIRITADVAEALAYAHAMGAVHRDLKPENILVPRPGPPGRLRDSTLHSGKHGARPDHRERARGGKPAVPEPGTG